MKDDYARDMRKRLKELESNYVELKSRAAKAEGQAKRDLEKKIEAAKEKRDEASRKLDVLSLAGSDGWQKAKTEFETAFAELKSVFE